MGNSTRTLQQLVDGVSTIGDLNPVLTDAGGYAGEPALTIANGVMSELISERFNFKWNRLKVPAFPLNANQQDYPSPSLPNLGWLESAAVVDINNTSTPKPTVRVETVRDLDIETFAGSPPGQICSLPNTLLEYGVWPGPGQVYATPVGALTTPVNPPTAILDPAGNILVLTTYGITGTLSPVSPAGIPGTAILDGTCVWTVADPASFGFRVSPVPPQAGNVWLVRIFAQATARRFTSLSQTLDPIPDDFSVWFERGFEAYATKHSANPQVQRRFGPARQEWMEALEKAVRQGDRETESKGFYPDRTVMDSYADAGLSAGYPYPGRRRY